MTLKNCFIIILIYNLLSCYAKVDKPSEVLRQPYNNHYTYTTNAPPAASAISRSTSGATLSSTKYMKHRRPQRRFVHRAYN